MTSYTSPIKPKASKISSRAIEGYPKESIKKMAVLFTDIVGSSQFFQSKGDIEGRRMLREHQDLASPPILEHGGIVVKMLGDSVMAYFLDAQEAVKAAIKIQGTFKSYNGKKNGKDQIHVRVGIHFGDGIVEERDIFGDVVNMAAKFLPLVRGDQIVVTRQVRSQIRGLPSIRLEPFELPKNSALAEGLILYSVLWDEGLSFDPLMKTLIYFRPLFNLGRANFSKAWNDLLRTKDHFWGGCVEMESLLDDKSVALIVRDTAFSLTLAKRILEHLRVSIGHEVVPLIPLQILIDAGSYLRAGRLALEELKVNWKEIDPGEVYISPQAHAHIKRTAKISINPAPDPANPSAFYKISLHDDQTSGSRLFLYQGALIQGEYPPCFYCGDKRHPTMACPSKSLTEITHGLSRLGYLPVDQINNLFFQYLNGPENNVRAVGGGAADFNNPAQWAIEGFYELKLVYQLRFFRALWNSTDENWNHIKERTGGAGEGGLVWIGQDCIRVSNMEQAQSVLLDSMNKDPHDYKVYCALGILNIEKSDFAQAKYYLNKSLSKAVSSPQKSFLYFLLSRLYDLSDDLGRAEEMIRKILYLMPYCSEAFYQDIVFRFRRGKEAVALHQLVKLIKRNREYYLHALMDPELAAYSDIIHLKLKTLLEEAAKESAYLATRAEEALEKIRKWLDEEDIEVSEASSRWQKIKELSQTNSYFGHLDIIHFAGNIINTGQKGIETRRRQLSTVLDDMKERAKKSVVFLEGFQYQFLIESVKKDLLHLQRKLEKDWAMNEPKAAGKFREAFDLTKGLSLDLDQIERRIHKLDLARKGLAFISGFFKKSLIFQSANLLVAMILFPILAYYLNFMMPAFTVNSQNMWPYQKTVLILGGVSGLLLAVISAAKSTQRKY